MTVSDGLFVHLNKAKKAISSFHKLAITNGLSASATCLGQRREEDKDIEKCEGRRAEPVPDTQAGV